MNKQDRKELQRAIDLLNDAKEIIESIGTCEQDKYDNLSEGLQATERGQKFEENASALENSASSIDDIISEIEETL